jgi:hypothetical protein
VRVIVDEHEHFTILPLKAATMQVECPARVDDVKEKVEV